MLILKTAKSASKKQGSKKTWILACPLGKQLSLFACLGPLVTSCMAWLNSYKMTCLDPCPLGKWIKKLLALKENLQVPDDQMALFSSPDKATSLADWQIKFTNLN